MIISHKHKYLFVEMNHTGSTAISEELCQNYGGREILWKHARYRDFMRWASAEEKKYFYFSGKRNPLDILVTSYYRHKLDPHELFCNIRTPDTTLYNYKLYRYIKKYNADFPTFFKKFFRWRIYYEWKGRDFKKLNHIYRFEQLQEEFSDIIRKNGLTQIRPLPIINQTAERLRNFSLYYIPEIQPWAKIVFRDLMREWGYDFPTDWRRPSTWHWIYYYSFLKPIFCLQKIFHLLIDHPLIYPHLYITDTGWSHTWRQHYKTWRSKIIDKFI